MLQGVQDVQGQMGLLTSTTQTKVMMARTCCLLLLDLVYE